NILNHFNCTLPIQRLWLADGLNRSAIGKAMEHLLPPHKTKSLYRASQARSLSDWYFIFPSMAYTRLNSHQEGITSVGRVQTPTLNLAVERDREVRKHCPATHYQIELTFSAGEERFICHYPSDGENILSDPIQLNLILSGLKQQREASVVEQMITTTDETETPQPHSLSSLQKALSGDELTISQSQKGAEQLYRKGLVSYPRTSTQTDSLSPPKPHSLLSLQGALQQQFSHTANHSSQLIQRLYDLGFISYPRTASQELPPNHINSPEQVVILKNLSQLPELTIQAKSCKGFIQKQQTPFSHTNDQTTSHAAHWAIIPTDRTPQLQQLTHKERAAYLEISRRYLQTLYPPAQLNQQRLLITITLPTGKKLKITHQTTQIKEPGWTAAFGHSIDEQPPIKLNGSQLQITQYRLITKQTVPPTHYNDYTLLLAMEHAGNHTTGIGTPATRADTIELLIDRGYLRRSGSTLRTTKRGASLIQQVPAWLRSARTTSKWEKELKQIASTEDDHSAITIRDQFTSQQRENITELMEQLLLLLPDRKINQITTPPSEKMIHYAETLSRKKCVQLPKHYQTDWRVCHDFINKHQ
ncbi:MAG: hypothetical protein HN842_03900, partial [Gammaproteobacteria bacterium]|nr:hypothetical protein [Gammaproteobacteria bacterium]